MKPLATSRRVMTWLCLLSAKEGTIERKNRSYVVLDVALIVTVLALLPSSLAYVIKFKSIDPQGAFFSLFTTAGATAMGNTIIVTYIFRQKIPPLFGQLSEIYGKYKDDDSFRFVVRANKLSEWLWFNSFAFIFGGFAVFMAATSMASALLCWIWNGHFDVALVFRPFRLVLPWDQSTLLGYFAEIFFIILMSEFYLLYNWTVLLTFVCICLHHWAFSKMFQHKLNKLNRPDGNRNRKECFHEIIDFHSTVKSWFLVTADVYSPHLAIQLICNMLMVAITVFRLDQQMSVRFDVNIVFLMGICISIQSSNLFLLCFFGKLASESYDLTADYLCDFDSHELPLNLQKYFIIMIVGAQSPHIYRGYGIIDLNLQTFTKLMRAVFTYYMLLKTLNKE